MDDSKFTYPEVPVRVGFTDAEQKRWNRNLKKLIERTTGKFSKKKRGRPPKEQTLNDSDSG